MLVRHYVETVGILHHCLNKVIIKSLPTLLHLMRGMRVDLFRIWLDTEEKWCRLNDFNCRMVLSVYLYGIVQYRMLMYYVTDASTVDPWTGRCREMFVLCCCFDTTLLLRWDYWLFILLCTFRFRHYIICTNLSQAIGFAPNHRL